MELKVKRITTNKPYTIGHLYIDDKFFADTLEDEDRGLTQSMSLEQISQKKIKSETAIPKGRYQVVWTYSDHFKQPMPLLLNVPGYAGVRIHSGNSAKDTEGCILVGKNDKIGWISNSREYIGKLYPMIEQACKIGKVFITIE